jgi:hypothetical protein
MQAENELVSKGEVARFKAKLARISSEGNECEQAGEGRVVKK